MAEITINEAEFPLANGGKGKVAVFLYYGGNPTIVLSNAIKSYVGDNPYFELMAASQDNPWMRVVVSNINDMKQEDFSDYIKRRDRRNKLKKINEQVDGC